MDVFWWGDSQVGGTCGHVQVDMDNPVPLKKVEELVIDAVKKIPVDKY